MHESNNTQTKHIAFIASDILTSDHDALADLYVLACIQEINSDDEDKEID